MVIQSGFFLVPNQMSAIERGRDARAERETSFGSARKPATLRLGLEHAGCGPLRDHRTALQRLIHRAPLCIRLRGSRSGWSRTARGFSRRFKRTR